MSSPDKKSAVSQKEYFKVRPFEKVSCSEGLNSFSVLMNCIPLLTIRCSIVYQLFLFV